MKTVVVRKEKKSNNKITVCFDIIIRVAHNLFKKYIYL